MKIKQIFATCGALTALFLGVNNLAAQDNGGGFGGGPGNFDPAQFQQRMMDNIRDQLGFTNDTDWNAVQPLVQKVMDARRDLGNGGGMRMMFRRGGPNGGGDNGNNNGRRRGGFFGGQPSPEEEALQNAIDNNAPTAQINDALEKYRASQKDKQAKLLAAQEDLKKVLQPGKQEAEAVLLGLVN